MALPLSLNNVLNLSLRSDDVNVCFSIILRSLAYPLNSFLSCEVSLNIRFRVCRYILIYARFDMKNRVTMLAGIISKAHIRTTLQKRHNGTVHSKWNCHELNFPSFSLSAFSESRGIISVIRPSVCSTVHTLSMNSMCFSFRPNSDMASILLRIVLVSVWMVCIISASRLLPMSVVQRHTRLNNEPFPKMSRSKE